MTWAWESDNIGRLKTSAMAAAQDFCCAGAQLAVADEGDGGRGPLI